MLGGLSPVIAVDRKAAKPIHRQIYDSYRATIVGGNLRSGQQIPSTRALASELGISRIPVLNAYAQLLAEGYISGQELELTEVAVLHEGCPPQWLHDSRHRLADVVAWAPCGQ